MVYLVSFCSIATYYYIIIDIMKLLQSLHVACSDFLGAEKKFQVPFLHHITMECDHHGLEYTNKDHDITIKIPKGSVPVNETIHLEIAVAMYGPFRFPENMQPISPIVWVCFEENIVLSNHFQLIIPHFLIRLTKEKAKFHQIRFAKANHRDCSIIDGEINYMFQHDISLELSFASSGCRSFAVLSTNHCCFYCLLASNATRELAIDAGYCLARIEAFIEQQKSEVYFLGVYCLPTCLRVRSTNFEMLSSITYIKT